MTVFAILKGRNTPHHYIWYVEELKTASRSAIFIILTGRYPGSVVGRLDLQS